MMQDFQFYVTDDRYSIPSFMCVVTKDVETARSMAERMLDNEHYHAVEVWLGERKLFTLDEALAR